MTETSAEPTAAPGKTGATRSYRQSVNPGPVIYVLGRLFSQGLEFALWVVAVRALDLGSAGIMAIALLATRYGGFIADWGATFSGARDVAQRGVTSAHTLAMLRRRELATLFVTVAFVLGVMVVGRQELVPLSGLILFRGLNRDWMALGTKRWVSAAVPNFVAQVSSLSLGLLLSPDLLPVAYGLGGLFGVGSSLLLNRRQVSSATAVITGPRGWYVLAGLAGLIYTTIDTFMLGLYRTSEDVAVYASIYRIVNAWLLLVGLTVGAAVPHIAFKLATTPAERAGVRSMLSKVAAAGGVAVLLATPAALWISPHLFGPDFAIGRTPLAILMVATAVTTLGAPYQVLVIVDGLDRTTAGVMVASALMNLVANTAAIPAYGMTGAAATTLASQTVPAVFYWLSSRRNPA